MKQDFIGVNLPFLKPKTWPKLQKMSGESRYGFSEDDDLIEEALDHIMQAIENKDHKQLTEGIQALVDCIRNREDAHADANEEA